MTRHPMRSNRSISGWHRAGNRRLTILLLLSLFSVVLVPCPGAAAPLTRSDCLATAFEHNPVIRRHRTELERAAGTQLVYYARGWPRLNAQLRGGWRSGDLYDGDEAFSTVDGRLAQPLIDVGIPASRRRGRLEQVLARQGYYQAVTDQLAATEELFLWARFHRDILEIRQQLRDRLQANVVARQQQVAAGAASRAAVVQARIQLLDLETQVDQAETEYHHACTRLAELTGQPAADLLAGALAADPAAATLSSEAIDWPRLVDAARAERPDLALLGALVAAAEEDEKQLRAGYYPRIELVANGFAIPDTAFRREEAEVIPGRDLRNSEVRIGPVMTWQVIDNGRTTGPRRRALARAERFRGLLAALENNLPREFEQIRTALESAAARQRIMTAAVDQAETSLALIEQKLDVGTATQLEYLHAQRDLLHLRAGLAWAGLQQARAGVDLNRAAGRYLRFVEVGP